MRTHHRAILLCTVAFGLVLPCGCAKKQNVPTTPVPLKIGIQSAFEYLSYGGEKGTERLFSWGPPYQIQVESTTATRYGTRRPPNEQWIFTYQGLDIDEAGENNGNTRIRVCEDTIWSRWNQQEELDTIRRACAATAAHEIGHSFLGGNGIHVTDPDDHVRAMHYPLPGLLPTLRQSGLVVFSPDELAIIRGNLGYN